jgi:hypothetical protein
VIISDQQRLELEQEQRELEAYANQPLPEGMDDDEPI